MTGTLNETVGGVARLTRIGDAIEAAGCGLAASASLLGMVVADDLSGRLTGFTLACWIIAFWLRGRKIRRLEANCGVDREPDTIIKTGATTIRAWYRR